MKIFTTQAQLRKHKHGRPGVAFKCGCCKAVVPLAASKKYSCATGYGYKSRDAKARPVCYPCLDASQREKLKDRSKPFCAYLSNDGKAVTTWTGGLLMRVDYATPCQLIRASYTHARAAYRSWWATDCHGGRWYGRGSAGVSIRLRACK